MSWKAYQSVTIVTYMFRKCVTILKTRMWILVFLWPFQLYWNQHLSNKYRTCCCCSVAKSCPTPCDPKSYSPPGSSVHGILQARISELVASSFFRGPSQPRDRTQVSYTGRWVLYQLSYEGSLFQSLALSLMYCKPKVWAPGTSSRGPKRQKTFDCTQLFANC